MEVGGVNDERKNRTLKQNRSLHLYCQLLADALNDAGLDMRRTLKEDIEIPWTKENVKEFLWRPIQDAMFQQASTTELNTAQVGQVYEVLNRHMSEKKGVSVSFPEEDWRQ